MKVLYISNYAQNSGYSQAARDYILALDSVGIDVVPRPIFFGDSRIKPLARIMELENKDSHGVFTHVIQHTLPQYFEYCGGMKNIGLFASETSNFKSSTWANHINMMDEAWVINRQQVDACKESGINRPIKIVPHAVDVTKFEKKYEPIKELKDNLCGNFSFYTIGELITRKNLIALLKAFHSEFDPSESVSLVIKTSKPGFNAIQVAKEIESISNQIKVLLKLYKEPSDYHKEHLLSQKLSDEGIMRLHTTCDCFVSSSSGEAWSLPTMDAMGFGKTPITPACTGFLDYINNDVGWLVNCHKDVVFGETNNFPDLYTGSEYWWQIDIPHLRQCMREAFENNQLRKEKSINGIDKVQDFSYERIGNLMKSLLYESK